MVQFNACSPTFGPHVSGFFSSAKRPEPQWSPNLLAKVERLQPCPQDVS